jgi:hypothetical protein
MAATIQIKRANSEADIINSNMAVGELALCTSTCALWTYNGVTKCIVGRATVDDYSSITTYSGTSGRFFYASDTEQLFVHDGAAWNSLGITQEQLTTTSGDIISYVNTHGGGSGTANVKTYTQTSHGFSVQQALYRKSDSTWALAKADAEDTAEALGIIQSVNGDDFTIVMGGEITGLSGLVDGTTYFLSPFTAGLLTSIEPDPTLYISKPLLTATSSTTGIVVNMRGLQETGGTGETGSYVTQNKLTTTSGDIITQIPSLAEYATQLWVNSGFPTLTKLTTTSGDIITQIPSLSGYATQSWVNSDFATITKLTTASGDIVSQIPAAHQAVGTSATPTFEDVVITGMTGSIISTTNVQTSIQELDESIYKKSNTGFDTWTSGSGANTWTITGDGRFQIDRAGVGFIQGKKVSWSSPQSTDVMTSGNCSWIYMDSSGVIHTTTAVTSTLYSNNIVLFEVLYDGVTYDVVKENHPYTFDRSVSGFLHNNLGIIIRGLGAVIAKVGSGSGSSAEDRRVKIVGADILEDHGLSTAIPDSAGTGVTWQCFYKNDNGKWVHDMTHSELCMYYNNAGVTTALTIGGAKDFNVSTLYVSKDNIESADPTYISVMGNGYATQIAAQTAINDGTVNYASNELSSLELAQLGFVIIQNNGDGGCVVDTTVAKSTFNKQLVGGSPGESHSSLTDLDYASSGHTGFVSDTDPRLSGGGASRSSIFMLMGA